MTAELAVALPAVVLVLGVLLLTGAATAGQLRCADAARSAARLAALREPDAAVVAAARRVAGPGAVVEIVRESPWVEVTVSGALGGSWFTGGPVGLTGRATAWVEP